MQQDEVTGLNAMDVLTYANNNCPKSMWDNFVHGYTMCTM